MIENQTISPAAPRGTRMSFPLVLGLLVLFFGTGVGAGYLIWGRAASQLQTELTEARATLAQLTGQDPAAITDPNAPRQVTRYPVPEDDDPSFGPADAPITIIEFSDFECPYCSKWHAEVWPKIQAAYGDQVRLVYRDFPLFSIHPNAGSAAEAANCANDQGKYWEFHDLLFAADQGLGKDAYLDYAARLGLDEQRFLECYENNTFTEEVDADYTYAVQLGVQSTPTFFINGIALIGAQPFEVFQEVIELELAGKFTP